MRNMHTNNALKQGCKYLVVVSITCAGLLGTHLSSAAQIAINLNQRPSDKQPTLVEIGPSFAPLVEPDIIQSIEAPRKSQNPEWLFEAVIAVVGFWLTVVQVYLEHRRDKRETRKENFEITQNLLQELDSSEGFRNTCDVLKSGSEKAFLLELDKNKFIEFYASPKYIEMALQSSDDFLKYRVQSENKIKEGTITPKEHEEYQITSTLRQWFYSFLDGIERFEKLVDSNILSIDDIKPYLIDWIRSIADLRYPYRFSSKVTDDFQRFIVESKPKLKNIFMRHGHPILAEPHGIYQKKDFDLGGNLQFYSTPLALSLAKAARLAYQDKDYITEISMLWGVKNTQENLQFFDNKKYSVQGFIFRTDNYIVLAFQSNQGIFNWLTDSSSKLRNFTILREGIRTLSSSRGKVHTSFFLFWASIEREVLTQIKTWQNRLKPDERLPPLLITGHDTGGTLATLAAASLLENDINIAGLYTFGQPRVGDITFTRQLQKNLTGKVFRFVNSKDVFPHVPIPFTFRNLTKIYAHLGTIKYFNSRGLLLDKYQTTSRLLDSISGLIKSLFESNFDNLMRDHNIFYYVSYLKRCMDEEIQNKNATKLENDVRRESERGHIGQVASSGPQAQAKSG